MNMAHQIKAISILLALFTCVVPPLHAHNCSQREILEKIPGSDYKKDIPPSAVTDVVATLHIHYILYINEQEQSALALIELRAKWKDHRLSYTSLGLENCTTPEFVLLTKSKVSHIWTPPITLLSVEAKSNLAPSTLKRRGLSWDGKLRMDTMYTMKTLCATDYTKFPFDTIECTYTISVEAPPDPSVDLRLDPVYPMQFDHSILRNLPMFYYYNHRCQDSDQANPDMRSCYVLFKRYPTHYILLTYVPNSVTVVVAWFGFFINPDAVPARTGLGISCLIAMVLQFGNLIQKLPKVGYLKGIDVWALGCLSFVFFNLAETAAVLFQRRGFCGCRKEVKIAKKLDSMSVVVYALCFCVFVYWYFQKFVK